MSTKTNRIALAVMLSIAPTLVRADPAQNEKVVGLARTVCAQAGIVLHCRKLYTVDERISEGLSRTARQTLDQVLGPQRATEVITDESGRVAREIDEIGADQWCADQRGILNADGAQVFVD